MTTVTVTINPRTKRAQGLLTIIQELAKIDKGVDIKTVENKKLPKATPKPGGDTLNNKGRRHKTVDSLMGDLTPALSEAIKDINAGRVYKAKNANQMVNDCLK
ncbi:MAG TPA: hypothetical protein PLS94_14390 [Prolixibacteraceae bacterium]|nr:hypothetical protein [Prolixibacteraceae bacterium]